MTEPVDSAIAVAPQDASPDTGALIASLRAAGAARFDPVRWHYLETLSERAATHQGSVKCMLDSKLTQALTAFDRRFQQAQDEAKEILAQGVRHSPHTLGDLQRLFDAGDFKGLQRSIAKLKSSEQCAALSALVRELDQQPKELAATPVQVTSTRRSELKTLRNFRSTWAKLSVDKQLTQALAQAPKNAGPINSHMLMLRSLKLMRDISPDYLNRFMSYADTLLCLEQGEKEKLDKPKKRPISKAAKKP